MYCPNCGMHYEREQHFCRSCGCNLSDVSAALSGEFKSAEMMKIEEKYLKRVLGGALYTLALVLAILWIIRFAVGRITGDDFTPFLLVLTWIAAAIFFLSVGVARYKRKLEKALLSQAALSASRESAAQAMLESPLQRESLHAPSSVTEQTTERLPERVTHEME